MSKQLESEEAKNKGKTAPEKAKPKEKSDKQKLAMLTEKTDTVSAVAGMKSEILSDDISAGQIFKAAEKNGNVMKNYLKTDKDGSTIVDFGKNLGAEHNIGLSDIM
jgi:hypothetical protein